MPRSRSTTRLLIAPFGLMVWFEIVGRLVFSLNDYVSVGRPALEADAVNSMTTSSVSCLSDLLVMPATWQMSRQHA